GVTVSVAGSITPTRCPAHGDPPGTRTSRTWRPEPPAAMSRAVPGRPMEVIATASPVLVAGTMRPPAVTVHADPPWTTSGCGTAQHGTNGVPQYRWGEASS